MKANAINFLEFIQAAKQFMIPIYQRNYSWTQTQCKQLWADIMKVGRRENESTHFVGSVVYVQRGHSTATNFEPLMVIDGQQRLTTVTLLLAALADHMKAGNLGQVLEAFSYEEIRENFLINRHKTGDKEFRLILSEADRKTLEAIMRGTGMPTNHSTRVKENYDLFRELITANEAELDVICMGVSRLEVVDVALESDKDNPQLIFESMNSTGLDLSQADLIRNFILMGLGAKHQTELYKTHWRPMEEDFGQSAYEADFDSFMRHYLTAKTGEIPNIKEVYSAFKAFAADVNGEPAELVSDIHLYARYYCAMALGKETDPKLKSAFNDLRDLKVDVAYPFLLQVYHDHKQGALSTDETVKIVRLIESYVFRRAICDIPTNSLNKTFAGLMKTIQKDQYLESLTARLMLLPSYRRFPTDVEFTSKLKSKDVYNFRNRSYWLRRIENHNRNEPIAVANYTIEHIMPQNPDLCAEWRMDLGPDWKEIQTDLLHTIGNLTLTGYNAQYSDSPFAIKHSGIENDEGMQIGFVASPLRLNEDLIPLTTWNKDTIEARAERLSTRAKAVWARPVLSDEVLDKYRFIASPAAQTYPLEHHEALTVAPMKEVFDSLRDKILVLDTCVNMEVKKLYVAFKAETNFVDIIPKKTSLKLVLNMRFDEIEDPNGICEDVSGKGRWGNGDVEFTVKTMPEIDYAMKLIEQSLQLQITGD